MSSARPPTTRTFGATSTICPYAKVSVAAGGGLVWVGEQAAPERAAISETAATGRKWGRPHGLLPARRVMGNGQ
jgi:hypothetical protein